MTYDELREAEIMIQGVGWKVLREYLTCAEGGALSVVLEDCGQLSDFSTREQAIGQLNYIKNMPDEFKAFVQNAKRTIDNKETIK